MKEKDANVVSIHLYFICGSIHVQGKCFMKWGTYIFPQLKEPVDRVAAKIKKAREEIMKPRERSHEIVVQQSVIADNDFKSGAPTQKKDSGGGLLSDTSKLSVAGALLSPQASSTPLQRKQEITQG